jgi:hypothetical protein
MKLDDKKGPNVRLRFEPRFSPVSILLILAFVFSALQLNQSSVGMYLPEESQKALFGQDRPIRSDEWYVRLPWLVSQADRGFPTSSVTSGSHDTGITYDLPALSADVFVRPHLIPYFLFGIDRAIATEWWFLVFGSAIAVYLFLRKLAVRMSHAFPAALLVSFNPGLHWWTVNSSFSIILYGCLGAVLLLHALEKSEPVKVFSLTVLSGWMFSCAALVLYPPFQIPTLVLIGLLTLIQLTDGDLANLKRERFRLVSYSFATFIIICIWFIVKHRNGLNLMAGTVYPGERRSAAGGVNVASLFGAPFDLKASGIISGSINRTNQSENASSVLMILPIVLSLPVATIITVSKSRMLQFRTASLWFVFLMSWMLLPLPDIFGTLSLLNRVQPDRIKPVLIFVVIVAVALFLESIHQNVSKLRLLTGFLFFGFVTVWAGSQYLVNDVAIRDSEIWLLSLMWLVPLAILLFVNQKAGLWLLVAVTLFFTGQINPLHNSVSPLTNNALASEIEKIDPRNELTWMTFSGTPQVRGVITASGSNVLTSVSPYPDFSFWKKFDPSLKFESAWNRYGHVQMIIKTGGTRITSTQSDVIVVELDPCDQDSPIESGTIFVESDPTIVSCAVKISDVMFRDVTWHIMRKR